MSEENENKTTETGEIEPQESATRENVPEISQRRFFTRRNGVIASGIVALLAIGFAILLTVFYRYGVYDSYVKAQFVSKMVEIGVVFDADVFRLTVSPLELQLKNATFTDKLTGEKLFFIQDARLGLSIKDLYALALSRVSIDTTEVDGAEVFVKFDENGKSNFSNLHFVEDQAGARVSFIYSSLKFSLKNGLIHFGDVQHKISADAKNILFLLEPENYNVPDEQKRYKFDLTSTASNFVYDESPIEPVDIRAKGIADDKGADISEFKLTSPIGESTLNGTITDWKLLKYNLNIESTVDLTQASSVLPLGTAIRGVGNFSGKVTGEGTKYNIEGEVQSDALAAENIRLKGLNIAATVAGENSMYDINGKAVAELLTFEDFQINALQLIGNIRGTGTDFKWFGELQAAAAKSPLGTIAGLYITDAVAEYKDEQLGANLGNVRAQRFSSEDVEIQTLLANNVKITNASGTTSISAPNVRASSVKTDDATLRGVNAGDVRVSNRGDRTDVKAGNVRAENVEAGDFRLRNLRANNVDLTANGSRTDVTANQVQADSLDAEGAKVGNLNASNVDAQIVGNETVVYSDNLKVAKLETDAAILGSINVAGVRLKIRQGRIEATSGDINAGNVALTSSAISGGGNLENVKLFKPVFVLEPSGRYRASADMSLGGGVLGSIKLGAARANVIGQNDQIALNNLSAEVFDGNLNGKAVIALNNRNRSQVDAEFSNLDLSKLLALQGGQVVPIDGKTTGNVNLTFAGTNFKIASGTVSADFAANAGTTERGLVPVNGKLGLTATNGLFNVDFANLFT
ncbi:MAG: AsmA-like C-terminal region-containing protein, partial [Acidobacteriota bacterium]|nr:AsmA-like C-terminal region-containing protein [Acidobacteriota bacterium]